MASACCGGEASCSSDSRLLRTGDETTLRGQISATVIHVGASSSLILRPSGIRRLESEIAGPRSVPLSESQHLRVTEVPPSQSARVERRHSGKNSPPEGATHGARTNSGFHCVSCDHVEGALQC